MSKVIPFLEMFSALGRWTELASAVEPWQITAVVLNRAQRSADIQVAGAAGAGHRNHTAPRDNAHRNPPLRATLEPRISE